MPLDDELQAVVDLVNAAGAPPPSVDEVGVMRDSLAVFVAAFGEGSADVEVEGVAIPNGAAPMALRVYRPAHHGSARESSRLGAFVWFHGGGWVIGDLDTHDAVCRDICAGSGVTVISVDYRLAPEHPYPAANDDAFRAVNWIVDHAAELEIDPGRVAVGGDSAGGHLAAAVARRARDEGGPELALQVLVYPVTDLHGAADRYPSRQENAVGYVLTTETMDFFRDTYVPDPEHRALADASPMSVDDLSGLPAAVVLTAEFDPLRDEGEAYAQRLAAAGVDTVCTRYDGAVHLFFQMRTTGVAQRAIAQVADAVRASVG